MYLNCDQACGSKQAGTPTNAEPSSNCGPLRCASLPEIKDPQTCEVSGFEFGDYSIRVAEEKGRLREISALVNRMYAWRGYQTPSSKPVERPKNQVTLEGIFGNHLFGTLSVTLDSPGGLAAEGLYTEELNTLRKVDSRLCEFTQLAIEPRFNSKDFLARLIHVAFVYAHLIQHASDMVIEVNPRHVGFYRRMLGFSRAGPERLCERVLAPAVLMHIDLAFMGQQIARHGGGNRQDDVRSLYPHFFSPDEQSALCERMSRHVEARVCGAAPILSRDSNRIIWYSPAASGSPYHGAN
jgi:hypothetical protein